MSKLYIILHPLYIHQCEYAYMYTCAYRENVKAKNIIYP